MRAADIPNDSFFGSLVVVVDIVLILSKTVDSVQLVNKINYSRCMSFELMTSYIFIFLSDRQPLLIGFIGIIRMLRESNHLNLFRSIEKGNN